MGRAARWLKGLLGMKNDRENSSGHGKEKKKEYDFEKSGLISDWLCNNPATIPPNLSEAEAAWIRSCFTEKEKEQNKHAIAVAAATAAAADAAVAAAQAAAAVVRLTSHGRGTMFGGGRERWASVMIQSVFRGFLARKALRALKGLVKIQALFRGYLIRKQAATTLYCMQSLVRAQTTIRSQRARSTMENKSKFDSQNRPRTSNGRLDETRSDRTASFHSRRLSASMDMTKPFNGETPKIVEIDTGRPKSRSRKVYDSVSEFGDDPYYQSISSPHPHQIPARLSMPSEGHRSCHCPEWLSTGEEYRFDTAHSTPRFMNSCHYNPAVTPAKSVYTDSYFREYSNSPNYMSNTKSFKAKLRSFSAPRQRPEPVLSERKQRPSLIEMMESRNSFSGVKMQRSCSQAQEAINFKNAVMGRFDKSSEFTERYYSQRR